MRCHLTKLHRHNNDNHFHNSDLRYLHKVLHGWISSLFRTPNPNPTSPLWLGHQSLLLHSNWNKTSFVRGKKLKSSRSWWFLSRKITCQIRPERPSTANPGGGGFICNTLVGRGGWHLASWLAMQGVTLWWGKGVTSWLGRKQRSYRAWSMVCSTLLRTLFKVSDRSRSRSNPHRSTRPDYPCCLHRRVHGSAVSGQFSAMTGGTQKHPEGPGSTNSVTTHF